MAIYSASPAQYSRPAHGKRKLFTYLRTIQGEQAFQRRFSSFILKRKHRHGDYLFTLTDSLDNFEHEKVLQYRQNSPVEKVKVFFFARRFELGVICMSMTGQEVFIEL